MRARHRRFLLILSLIWIGARADAAGVSWFSLQGLQQRQADMQIALFENPAQFTLLYIGLGMLLTAMPVPVVTIYHVAAGAFFGFSWGLACTLLGTNFGATLSFLITRFFLRDFVQKRWGRKLAKLNYYIEKEGSRYLITLRLIPGFPFFLTNLAMALTPISISVFFMASLLGSIPVTAALVNAGTKLAQVRSGDDLLSPPLWGSLVALAVLSALLRFFRKKDHVPEILDDRQPVPSDHKAPLQGSLTFK